MQDHSELEGSIRAVLARQGLQQPAAFVTKVVQLYDTMCVRFGLMLVGPAGTGKTACCRALQGALTHLRQELQHPNEQFQVRPAGAAAAPLHIGAARALAHPCCVLHAETLRRAATAPRTTGDARAHTQPQVHQDGRAVWRVQPADQRVDRRPRVRHHTRGGRGHDARQAVGLLRRARGRCVDRKHEHGCVRVRQIVLHAGCKLQC